MVEFLEITISLLVLTSTIVFKAALSTLLFATSAFIVMLIAYAVRTWNETKESH